MSKELEDKTNAEKILVVDDEPGMVIILSKFLTHHGYEVVTAEDGVECIAKAQSEHETLALILLDNLMPNMDGQTALMKLRALNETRDIPVIIVTALSDEEDMANAQKKGAVDYIVKPFDYAVLLEKIKQTIKPKHNVFG